jgi:hypothetical protein
VSSRNRRVRSKNHDAAIVDAANPGAFSLPRARAGNLDPLRACQSAKLSANVCLTDRSNRYMIVSVADVDDERIVAALRDR